MSFLSILPEYIQLYIPLLSKKLISVCRREYTKLDRSFVEEKTSFELWNLLISNIIKNNPDLCLTDHWFALLACESMQISGNKEAFERLCNDYSLSPPIRIFSIYLAISKGETEAIEEKIARYKTKYFDSTSLGLLEVAIGYRLFSALIYFYRRTNQYKKAWDLFPLFQKFHQDVKKEYCHKIKSFSETELNAEKEQHLSKLLKEWEALVLEAFFELALYDPKEDLVDKIYLQLQKLEKDLTNIPFLGKHYLNMGYYYLELRDLKSCENAFKTAINNFMQTGNLERVATAQVALSNVLLDEMRFEEAIEVLTSALEILEKHKSTFNTVVTLMMIITAHYGLSQENKAKEYYSQLIQYKDFFMKFKDPNFLFNLAQIAHYFTDVKMLREIEQKLQKEIDFETSPLYIKMMYHRVLFYCLEHELDLKNMLLLTDKILKAALQLRQWTVFLTILLHRINIYLSIYLQAQDRTIIERALSDAELLSRFCQRKKSPTEWLQYNTILCLIHILMSNLSLAKYIFKDIKLVSNQHPNHELTLYLWIIERILSHKNIEWNNDFLGVFSQEAKEHFKDVFKFINNAMLAIITQRLISKVRFSIETAPKQLEEPLIYAMLIITPAGIPVYSQIFDQNFNVDQQLLGGFISALSNFAREIFSAETHPKQFLRAIEYQEWTLLVLPSKKFYIVLVSEDQSFSLWEQLNALSKLLEEMPEKLLREIERGMISIESEKFIVNCINQSFQYNH